MQTKTGDSIISISLRNVPLFKDLPAADLESLRNMLRERSFARGQVLFTESSPCERVSVIKSGRVKLFRMDFSGKEQILKILEPGDTCACNPGVAEWSCSASAEALTECTVWYFSTADYARLLDINPVFARNFAKILAKRLQCFSALIEDISLKDVKRRLVKFLLDTADEKSGNNGNQGTILVSFTRNELSQRLGTTRETISRYLSQLQKSKLIDLDPDSITILDKKALIQSLK